MTRRTTKKQRLLGKLPQTILESRFFFRAVERWSCATQSSLSPPSLLPSTCCSNRPVGLALHRNASSIVRPVAGSTGSDTSTCPQGTGRCFTQQSSQHVKRRKERYSAPVHTHTYKSTRAPRAPLWPGQAATRSRSRAARRHRRRHYSRKRSWTRRRNGSRASECAGGGAL